MSILLFKIRTETQQSPYCKAVRNVYNLCDWSKSIHTSLPTHTECDVILNNKSGKGNLICFFFFLKNEQS